MNCFNDMISVGGSCETSHTYNLTSVDITESFLNKIVGSEYDNGADLGRAKIDFAAKEMSQSASDFFSRNAYTTSVIEQNTIGRRNEGQLVAGFTKSGIRFKLLNNTAHVKLSLVTIQLQLDTTADVTVYVYDLHDGSVIGSKVVSVVSGIIATANIEISKSYSKRNTDLAVVYDSSSFDSYKYTVTANCANCDTFHRVGQFVEASAVDFTGQVLAENAITKTHTSGLSVVYSLCCDYSDFLCSIKNQLALPLLHKIAADIYFYQLSNTRWNDRSDDEKENVMAKIKVHAENYEDGMKRTLQNMGTPNNICFGCSDKLRLVNTLPG